MTLLLAQQGVARCHDRSGKFLWESPVCLPGQNGLTTAGLNGILDGNVFGQSLYFGLIASSGWVAATGLQKSDTMASHAGWAEEHSNYSQSTRPGWSYGSAAGGVLSSSSVASFTFTATVDIKGFFLVTNSTKNGSTGILVTTALFTSGDRSPSGGQTVTLDFLMRAAEGG